jgi:acyl-homoserine-lactone acylase
MLRRLLWAAGLLTLILGLALGGVILVDRLGQPAPPSNAALIAKGKAYDVRIRRDEFGVPHVLGRTDADAAFGLAFAHSEDDFATIQEVTLATRGSLAAANGPKAAVTDYFVRLLGVWGTVDANYARLPADLRRVLEAYADGVNDYAALHPNVVKAGLLPITGKDIAAGFVFKTPIFYGLSDDLARLNAPPPKAPPVPVGSNGVAVAPSRSSDGATRLLVNSHQPYTGPVAWYEAVVESGEGWHVAGGFFPGSPFMLHGTNGRLGWANTVNHPDLVDVYRLTLNPKNEDQYRLDGQWKDFEKTDAAIRVKLFGPLIWTFHRPVLRSVHGPVLKTDHGVFAIRYAGMGEYRQALQYWRLDKAKDMAEWRAAMAINALPSINYIFADEKGDIGYVYNGQFPNRPSGKGVDWLGTLPGDRSDLIWNGYLPFDRVPQIFNPKSGYVFNSNNTPFRATGPGDALKPGDFAPEMGLQTNLTNRALRAEETFGSDTKISAEAFRAYKFDISYSDRSDVVKLAGDILKIDARGDPQLLKAQAIVRAWDHRTDVHNRGTALVLLTAVPILTARDEKRPEPPLLETLRGAMTNLTTHFGRLDPEWGQLNRIRRGQTDLAIDGGPDTYRAVYGEPQTDGTLTAKAGDTFIMFVTWDRLGVFHAESIHQFGSATLDRLSPHYADQTPLFVAMKTKPVWFTEDELKPHIREDYRPGERPAR